MSDKQNGDRPWWRRLYIDWKYALLVSAVSVAAAAKLWLESQPGAGQ